MGRICCVSGCHQRYRKGINIPFHHFPLKNKALLNKWLTAIQRQDFTPTKHSYICGRHFNLVDYIEPPNSSLPRLRVNAVPSIFNFPSPLPSNETEKAAEQQEPDVPSTLELTCGATPAGDYQEIPGECKVCPEDNSESQFLSIVCSWLDGSQDGNAAPKVYTPPAPNDKYLFHSLENKESESSCDLECDNSMLSEYNTGMQVLKTATTDNKLPLLLEFSNTINGIQKNTGEVISIPRTDTVSISQMPENILPKLPDMQYANTKMQKRHHPLCSDHCYFATPKSIERLKLKKLKNEDKLSNRKIQRKKQEIKKMFEGVKKINLGSQLLADLNLENLYLMKVESS